MQTNLFVLFMEPPFINAPPSSYPDANVPTSPTIPSPRAARASPAMRPPPRSEVLLMSEGRSSSDFPLGARVFHKLETMPPAPNQTEVPRFTKPPNENAYGDGRRN